MATPVGHGSGKKMMTLRDRVNALSVSQRQDLSLLIEAQEGSAAVAAASRLGRQGADRLQLVAYIVAADGEIDVKTINQRARQLLSDHQCPSRYVAVEYIPKLENGKSDYARLPGMAQSVISALDSAESDQTPVSPTTSRANSKVMDALIGILGELLGMSDIRAEDNFFEIGGDSIVAIQLVSRAREAGIPLLVSAITSARDLESLSATVNSTPVRESKVSAFGDAPLTPIQSWFFSHHHPAPAHWNMGGVLEFAHPVDSALVVESIRACVDSHPVLSSRFLGSDVEWTVSISDEPPPSNLVVVECDDGISATQQDAEVLKRMQADFDLASGWLLRFVVIADEPAPGGKSHALRLCWVIHHLICDGLSLQILLDGIKSECLRRVDGVLDAVEITQSSSYREWAHELQVVQLQSPVHEECSVPGYDSSDELWRLLPTEQSCEDRVIELEAELVSQLVQANEAYSTTTNELLMAAVAFAWQTVFVRQVVFDVEVHGRDVLGDDFDTSGVMGWFTSYFPLPLTGIRDLEVGDRIKRVKEAHRQLRVEGREYLLNKYGSKPVVPEICELTENTPSLLFNFINADSASTGNVATPFWASRTGPIELLRSPKNHRSHVIELNVLASRTRMSVGCRYVSDRVAPEVMEAFSHCIMEELQHMVIHCLAVDSTVYTPSDFPDLDMDQHDLDELMSGIELD